MATDAEREPSAWAGAVADRLRIAVMRTSRRLRTEAAGGQVTASQFSVLAGLKKAPATLSELAAREQVQPPSMTRTVQALVDQGLLERIEDPHDRRQVVVSLAPAGRRLVNETRDRRNEWLARRLAALDQRDRQVVGEAAEILLRIIES